MWILSLDKIMRYTSGRNAFKFGLETTLSIQESSKVNLVKVCQINEKSLTQ